MVSGIDNSSPVGKMSIGWHALWLNVDVKECLN
jgi:hypothetical protein